MDAQMEATAYSDIIDHSQEILYSVKIDFKNVNIRHPHIYSYHVLTTAL